jgi:hypothetical protein
VTRPGDSDDPRDPLPRDAWLRQALRHAPDADAAPPSALNEHILREARAALRPAAAAPPAPVAAQAWWQPLIDAWDWLARPPMAAGFASVMLAGVIGLMWWERPLQEALPPAVPVIAEAPPPVEMTAPAPTQAPAAPPSPAAEPPAATAPAPGRMATQAPSPRPQAAQNETAKRAPKPAESEDKRVSRERSSRPAQETQAAADARADTAVAQAPAVAAAPPAAPVMPPAAARVEPPPAQAAPAAKSAAPVLADADRRRDGAAGGAGERAEHSDQRELAAARPALGSAASAHERRAVAGLASPIASSTALRRSVGADLARWSSQRGTAAPRAADAALLDWLALLDDASRGRWSRDAAGSEAASADAASELTLLRDGQVQARIRLAGNRVEVDQGGRRERAELPADRAAALRSALDGLPR